MNIAEFSHGFQRDMITIIPPFLSFDVGLATLLFKSGRDTNSYSAWS